jgi:hypothetical protein
MSRWGCVRPFVLGRAAIRVIAHADGPLFAPIHESHIIDDLVMVHSGGKHLKDDLRLLEDLKRFWIGKTYGDWSYGRVEHRPRESSDLERPMEYRYVGHSDSTGNGCDPQCDNGGSAPAEAGAAKDKGI